MKILVLEDDPNRIEIFKKHLSKHDTAYTDTAQGAIDLLKANEYDVIFLDHDLGGQTYVDAKNTNTGSEVVRFLVEQDVNGIGCNIHATYIIHTMNPDAGKHMRYDLHRLGFKVSKIMFGTDQFNAILKEDLK